MTFGNPTTRALLAYTAMLGLAAHAQQEGLPVKPVLTQAAARRIAIAAENEACKTQCKGAFAVVDDGGYLLYLERLDGTPSANVELAIAKARTAAIHEASSNSYRALLEDKNETRYTTYPDLIAANGGVPLMVNGKCIGAFGESGYSVGAEGHHTDNLTQVAIDELAKIAKP